jgi:ADP-ribose pyrophosphatase
MTKPLLPAYSDEKIFIFLARALHSSVQNLDKDEIIKVIKYALERALQMIGEGRITDALTISLLAARMVLLKR